MRRMAWLNPIQFTMPNLVFRPLAHSSVSELLGIWREDDTSPLVQALRNVLYTPSGASSMASTAAARGRATPAGSAKRPSTRARRVQPKNGR